MYGTLRRGCPNENAVWLENTACYIGMARIRGRLFRALHYPALGPPLTSEDWVRGDVFERVNAPMFRRLDEYEGAEYTRQVAEITMENGQTMAAFLYCYALPIDGLEPIISGDWRRI